MVEEPVTDGNSDHTDSGATVNSKNTCELAVTRCDFLVLWIVHVHLMRLLTIFTDQSSLVLDPNPQSPLLEGGSGNEERDY